MSYPGGDVSKAIKESPALALHVLKTYEGAALFCFLMITSLLGVQKGLGSKGVFDFITMSGLGDLFGSIASTNRSARQWGRKLLLAYVAGIVLVSAIVIFAAPRLSTLAIVGVIVFFFFGLSEVFPDYRVANSFVRGAIAGTAVSGIVLFAMNTRTYLVGDISVDIFYVALLVYVILVLFAFSLKGFEQIQMLGNRYVETRKKK